MIISDLIKCHFLLSSSESITLDFFFSPILSLGNPYRSTTLTFLKSSAFSSACSSLWSLALNSFRIRSWYSRASLLLGSSRKASLISFSPSLRLFCMCNNHYKISKGTSSSDINLRIFLVEALSDGETFESSLIFLFFQVFKSVEKMFVGPLFFLKATNSA